MTPAFMQYTNLPGCQLFVILVLGTRNSNHIGEKSCTKARIALRLCGWFCFSVSRLPLASPLEGLILGHRQRRW